MEPLSRTGLLAAVVGFSLRYRGVVIVLAVLLASYGVYAFTGARYDVFPEFAPPQVSIQTEAPGLTPEQVEVLVTQPIENSLNGLPGVQALRSQSIQGLSVITVSFDPASDIYRDRQNVSERLGALAASLPSGVQAPTMSPLTSSANVVLVIGLTSQPRSLMELRTLADWTLKPRLLTVPGVAKVAVFGGEVKEFQIQVNARRLVKYDLALEDILDVARRATGVRGAGFIDNANQRILIQTQGQSLSTDQLARTVLRQQDGANLTLADVAQVRVAAEPSIGAAAVGREPAVQTAFQGATAGQIYDGNQVFNVSVILSPIERSRITDVGALPLRSAVGAFARLDQLADIYATSGRYAVLHDGARRVQIITCNVTGRDVASFVAEAKKRIAEKIRLAPGNYVEFGGTAAAQAASVRDLIVHSIIAAVALGLMLWMVLGRAKNLVLLLMNLPFALTGGVLVVFATGGIVSLGALVGFVTLFGITLRNSVMLLSHYEYLVVVEGLRWGAETVVRGAVERLTPILMTALATALGLLPLAISSGDPGHEIEGPMALVILGGLFTSTALNLLVMPSLAQRYAGFGSENGIPKSR